MAAAGVPGDVRFATKPQLAVQMIDMVVGEGMPARWVAGDEVYGGDPKLAARCRHHRLGYVLAVTCHHQVVLAGGRKQRVDAIAAGLPSEAWQRVSAGRGVKGHRYYDWAWISLPASPNPADHDGGAVHWLLIRRNRKTGELAYYRCWSPRPVPLSTLVKVAGRRWQIEEAFQACKTGLGLDEHQNRRWTSWQRWTTLAIAAHAFLAAATKITRQARPAPPGLIPLTLNELRQLFNIMIIEPGRRAVDQLGWSIWRRRHQYQAQQAHYARQALTEP